MTLNELQRQVKIYDERFGWTDDRIEQTLLHMQEELGEISGEILKMDDYRKQEFDRKRVNDEVSDLLYLAFKLGNHLKLDLNEGWQRIESRYKLK